MFNITKLLGGGGGVTWQGRFAFLEFRPVVLPGLAFLDRFLYRILKVNLPKLTQSF